MKKRLLISVGGTGGHLLPAQDLARKLPFELIFAAQGLKKSPFFDRSFPFYEIPAAPLGSWNFFPMLIKGVLKSFSLFKTFRPDCVIGFGSYHTFPLLLAALFKRIPIVLYEPNAVMGRVNRFFAPFAKKVATQLLEGKGFQPVSFLPWGLKPLDRESSLKELGLDPKKTTLLLFGGSQGAKKLNDLFLDIAGELPVQVIHLTGSKEEEERAKDCYRKLSIPAYVKAFEKRRELLLSSADLAVCRCGASTIGELLTFGIPSLLIPYPYSRDNHQEKNAAYLEALGAKVCKEEELNRSLLLRRIKELLASKEERKKALLSYSSSIQNRKSLEDLINEVLS